MKLYALIVISACVLSACGDTFMSNSNEVTIGSNSDQPERWMLVTGTGRLLPAPEELAGKAELSSSTTESNPEIKVEIEETEEPFSSDEDHPESKNESSKVEK
jgi:hypothetical protein